MPDFKKISFYFQGKTRQVRKRRLAWDSKRHFLKILPWTPSLKTLKNTTTEIF
jgi:hypothetical protein